MYKPLQIKAPKLVTQKKPPLNRPSKYKSPGGLSLEIAFKYKVKRRKTVNFLPTIRLSQSILKRKFPPRRQAPPNINPSKNKPLKKAVEKYSPGLIFGILRYLTNLVFLSPYCQLRMLVFSVRNFIQYGPLRSENSVNKRYFSYGQCCYHLETIS